MDDDMQLVNPEKFSCIQGWNTTDFEIADVERLGQSSSWQVLVRCTACFTGQTVKYTNINFENRLRKYLQSIIGQQKRRQSAPTSYIEWEYLTGKVHRDSHKGQPMYEELTI